MRLSLLQKLLPTSRKNPTSRPAKRLPLRLLGLEDRLTPTALVGLGNGNRIVGFDSSAPLSLTSNQLITGIASGETLVGIDFRPANGALYGLGDKGTLYTIDLASGKANKITTLTVDPADPTEPFTALNGTFFDIEWDPVTDRLRVVSDAGQNFSVNIANGTVFTDPGLSPGTPNITGAAFVNNVSGAATTTLYGIDGDFKGLYTIDAATGAVTLKGSGFSEPLGSGGSVGFDVVGNEAFATMIFLGEPELFTVDIAAGTAKLKGSIGAPVRDLAIVLQAAPTVTSIERVGGSVTDAPSVSFTVNFSDAVTGVDLSDFKLTTTGGQGTAKIEDVTGSGNKYTVTVSTGSASGTIRLDLQDDDTIINAGGTPLGGKGAGNGNFTTGQVFSINKAPAVVSSVRMDADPTKAATARFQVTFSESVTGVDVSDFKLTTTGGQGGATVSSISGSGATYTVTVNMQQSTGTVRLDFVSNGTVVNTGDAPTTADFTSGEVYSIDYSGPLVSSITRLDANPTNAASVGYAVTFNESVTGVDVSDFRVTTTAGQSGAQVVGVSGSNGSYTVTVTTGPGAGTVRLDFTGNGSVEDSLGNAGTTPFVAGEVYTFASGPVVTSIIRGNVSPTKESVVTFTVVFSEDVTGLDIGDFSVTMGAGLSGATVTEVLGSDNNFQVSVNTGTGSGTLRLDFVPNGSVSGASGTAAVAFTEGDSYVIDRTSPTVAITRATNQGNPTGNQPINFTVTFSEKVIGFDSGDIKVGGTAGATTAVVTTTDNITFNVAVSGATQSGTVSITFDAGAANDLAANASEAPTVTDGVVNFTNEPNAAPTIAAPGSAAVDENTTLNFTEALRIQVADADAGDNSIEVTLTATQGTVALANKTGLTFITGTGAPSTVLRFRGRLVDINNALLTLSFSPNANFSGAALVDVAVDDLGNSGTGGSKTATTAVDITVNAVNSAPVIDAPDAVSGAPGAEISFIESTRITITDSDAEDAEIEVTLTVTRGKIRLSNTNGILIIDGGDDTEMIKFRGSQGDVNAALNGLIYRSEDGFSGSDTLTINVDDLGNTGEGGNKTATATVAITVGESNQAPVITAPNTATVVRDTTLTFAGATNISIADPDAGGGAIKVTVAVTNGTVSLSGTAGLTFTTGDGTGDASMTFTGTLAAVNIALNGLKFQPAAAFTGGSTVTINVDDQGNTGSGGSKTATDTIAITVTAANTAPVARNDTFSTAANQTLTIAAPGVLANDSDAENGTLTATVVADVNPTQGTLTLAPNGGFTFIPANGFTGAVTFTYRVSDGTTNSDPATVTINVTPSGKTTVRLHAHGADLGGSPTVTVYGEDGTTKFTINAFDAEFKGGVSVATGDVDGDGTDDIIVGAGLGGFPLVRVFSGATQQELFNLMAFDRSFRGGVEVAAGDVDGDGKADIIVGSGVSSIPTVNVYSGSHHRLIQTFLAFDRDFRGGVHVAAGDLDGDGRADIVTGAGPGGSSQIAIYKGGTSQIMQSFLGMPEGFAGGARVAVGTFNARPAVFVAAGYGGVPVVQTFDYQSNTLVAAFMAFDNNQAPPAFMAPPASAAAKQAAEDFNVPQLAEPGGVRIASERQVDGGTTLYFGAGRTETPVFVEVDADTLEQTRRTSVFDPSFLGGVMVG